jgi:hypothetical protein
MMPWSSRPGRTTVALSFNAQGGIWSRQPGSAVPVELAGVDDNLWQSFLAAVAFTVAHFRWIRGTYMLYNCSFMLVIALSFFIIIFMLSSLRSPSASPTGVSFIVALVFVALITMLYAVVWAGWARAQDNCRSVRDLYEARFAALGYRLTFHSAGGRSYRGRSVRVAWFAIEQSTAAPPPYTYAAYNYIEAIVVVGTPMPQNPPPSYPLRTQPAVGVPVFATAVPVPAQPVHTPAVVVGTPMPQSGPAR